MKIDACRHRPYVRSCLATVLVFASTYATPVFAIFEEPIDVEPDIDVDIGDIDIDPCLSDPDLCSGPPAVPPGLGFAKLSHPGKPGDTDGSIQVRWDAAFLATNYKLDQKKNGGSWNRIYDGDGTDASRELGDGQYRYRVKACNSDGCSDWVTSAALTVLHPGAAGSTVPRPPSGNRVLQQ